MAHTTTTASNKSILGKLIKYDLKYLLKSITLFGTLLIACAILFNLTCYDSRQEIINGINISVPDAPVFIQFLHTVFYNGIFIFIIAMFLNCIIRIWHRYRTNFFGDEAYLIHTLPVKRQTLWLSKFLSIALTVASALLVTIISLFILSLTHNGQLLVDTFGIGTQNLHPIFRLLYGLTILTQLLYIAICGVVGTTLDNRTGRSSARKSIILGLAVYMAGVIIMLGVLLLASLIDPSIHAMIFGTDNATITYNISDYDFITCAIAGAVILYAIFITTLYGINQALLKKGINLD